MEDPVFSSGKFSWHQMDQYFMKRNGVYLHLGYVTNPITFQVAMQPAPRINNYIYILYTVQFFLKIYIIGGTGFEFCDTSHVKVGILHIRSPSDPMELREIHNKQTLATEPKRKCQSPPCKKVYDRRSTYSTSYTFDLICCCKQYRVCSIIKVLE